MYSVAIKLLTNSCVGFVSNTGIQTTGECQELSLLPSFLIQIPWKIMCHWQLSSSVRLFMGYYLLPATARGEGSTPKLSLPWAKLRGQGIGSGPPKGGALPLTTVCCHFQFLMPALLFLLLAESPTAHIPALFPCNLNPWSQASNEKWAACWWGYRHWRQWAKSTVLTIVAKGQGGGIPGPDDYLPDKPLSHCPS